MSPDNELHAQAFQSIARNVFLKLLATRLKHLANSESCVIAGDVLIRLQRKYGIEALKNHALVNEAVRNAIIDRLRSKKNREFQSLPESLGRDDRAARQARETLHAFSQTLDEIDQAIVECWGQGYSIQQTADALGLTFAAVAKRRERIKLKGKEWLQREEAS